MIRRVPRWLWIAALVAIAVRALLPFAIERYGESVIDLNGVYAGRIGDVDLALFRGALEIEHVVVEKHNGEVPVPLFAAPRIGVSFALAGAAVFGALDVEQPIVNLVAGPTPARSQTGLDADWSETAKRLEPLRLDRLAVRDGQLHFRAFHTDPPIDAYLQDVDLAAQNLKNSERRDGSRVARFALQATPMTRGLLETRARFAPAAPQPSFDLDGRLAGADLRELNDLLRVFLELDVEAGELSTAVEIEAEGGRIRGYVKPVVEDVELVAPDEVERRGPLTALWEGVVDATLELFEDPREEQVAARIPIAGRVEEPEARFWPAFGTLLRNAFVEGLGPRLEGSVGQR